jgi:hypothetical protein
MKVFKMPSSASVVLRAEKKHEFAELLDKLNKEIKPTGFLEEMYVEEFAGLVWEIIRLRGVKVWTINNAFVTALKNILGPVMFGPNYVLRSDVREGVENLARGWFSSEDTRSRVSALLDEAGLEESAVVAEAFRLSIDKLEKLDRTLTLAEARRDKTLRMIAEFKGGLAMRLCRSTERMLTVDNVPSLEDLPKEIEHA